MPTNPHRFQAVLFDLDDTLYSRRTAFASWLDAYLWDTLRLTDPAEVAQVQSLIHALDKNGYGSKQAIFERLHTLYPTLPGEPSRSLEIFFAEFLTHVRSETETEVLLDTLADAKIPFGVITNGSARQWRKIEGLGLARRTSCLFVSETFGGKKPDPAIFEAATAHLGVRPGDILFVGDNPAVDVLGAQAADMKAAWLHRGQPWPEELAGRPDYAVGSVSELAEVLGVQPFSHGTIGTRYALEADHAEEADYNIR